MIQTKASSMNLISPHTWTKEDDELIEKYYLTEGKNIVSRFNCKSYIAIQARAQKLGILKREYWTEEDDEILKQYYPLEGSDIYKRLNNKSRNSCRNRALKFGIQYISWTSEEDEIIRNMYYKFKGNVKEKSVEVHKIMPRKSIIAIENRFRKLGLYDVEKKCFLNWTNVEDEIIKKYYPSEGSKVANRLRNRTRRQIISRAKKMQIRKERNYDIEKLQELIKSESSIQNIAKIMKCSLETLESIMKENGLEWKKREKTSKYKYVYFDKRRQKYNVEFLVDGKKTYIGRFDSEEEAAKVAIQKAKEYGKTI